MAIGKLFMSKANRDAEWKRLRAANPGRKYRRTSIRGQLLHPQYVDDYEQVTSRKLEPADRGFGNTIYKTPFAVLYEVQELVS